MPQAQCIYDKDGYKMRAAAVCVRDDSEAEVLLVSSYTKPGSWIIPAGKVEPNEECDGCAVREAMEEGGAVGSLGRYLGTYDNKGLKKRTCVFVLRVERLVEDFPEKDRRRRQWFSISEATRLLSSYKMQHCDYLDALKTTKGNQQQGRCSCQFSGKEAISPGGVVPCQAVTSS